jgi:hypothetical protein
MPHPLLLSLLVLAVVAAPAHALTIYKCTDADGLVAFQEKPCSAHTRGGEFAVRAEPAVADAAPTAVAPAPRAGKTRATASSRSRNPPASRRRTRTPVVTVAPDASWECRAANGDVFYQHSPCPAAIAGNVELRHAATRGRSRAGTAAVAVSGRPIARADACRRIHAASAGDRSGHEHDEDVSTYERNLGRDPCR